MQDPLGRWIVINRRRAAARPVSNPRTRNRVSIGMKGLQAGIEALSKLETAVSYLVRALLPALAVAHALATTSAWAYRIWDFDPDAVHGFAEGPRRNDIVPGELIIDPPTIHNLGFRWYVEGDTNGNATVEVAYRRSGDVAWREALPTLRINHEVAARYRGRHCRTANLFAGSILFLDPETAYEVRFTMEDPDGGAPEEPRYLTVATRSEPRAAVDGRILHVYPPGFQGAKENAHVFDDLMSAYERAGPGDVFFLHAGVHPATGAPYVLTHGGNENRPIVFRGAGAGRTVIEGLGHGTDLFQLQSADHIMFEDLTLRRAHTAIRTGLTTGIGIDKGGPGATGLTVRRCHIENVLNGIWTTTEKSANWFIADNVITGIDEAWYPRPRSGYMDGSHTGVNIYGQGHVVCYNRISRFSDSLAIANYHPPPMDIRKQAVNIDFYNNDLSFAMDDTIEADYGCHNIRIYQNLCYNTHSALSIQPSYGGPVYLIRNVVYGARRSLKWSMVPSGPVAYHNTLISAGRAFSSPVWSNGHLRNNLFLGNGAIINTGTVTPALSTMDYNGWYIDRSDPTPIRWVVGEDDKRDYATLESFASDTGHERNGTLVDYGIFYRAAPVERGATYNREEVDLRLRPGSSAVNAGLRLPNVNDDFRGTAPDLGAYEAGNSIPHYGPREKDWDP